MAGQNELLEISVNGERVAVLEVDKGMGDEAAKGLTVKTPPIPIKAGPQRISAAFVPRSIGPVDDLLAPIDQTLIDTRIGTGFGITARPTSRSMTVNGPHPGHRRFGNAEPAEDLHVSSDIAGAGTRLRDEIIQQLATRAYRGPATRRSRRADEVLRQARHDGRRLRVGHPDVGAGGFSPTRVSCSASSRCRRPRRRRRTTRIG